MDGSFWPPANVYPYPIPLPTAVIVNIPSFNRTSVLVHPGLTGSYGFTRLVLELRPSASDGLLLYNGGLDFIAVVLRDGVPEFRYNLGSGTAIIRGSSPLALNQWHRIEVERMGQTGQLVVNGNLPVVSSSPGSSFSLQLGGNLFLGGAGDNPQISFNTELDVGFVGCVRLLEVTPFNVAVRLTEDAISGSNVVGCAMDSCTEVPCQNNGECRETPSSGDVTCVCTDGFFGDFCQFESIDCAVADPCQNGGDCTAMTLGNGTQVHECQCFLPYSGTFCTEREYWPVHVC